MEFVLGCVTGLLGCMLGLTLIGGVEGRQEVVKHGCAHYDSQTGDFTWNKEATSEKAN